MIALAVYLLCFARFSMQNEVGTENKEWEAQGSKERKKTKEEEYNRLSWYNRL